MRGVPGRDVRGRPGTCGPPGCDRRAVGVRRGWAELQRGVRGRLRRRLHRGPLAGDAGKRSAGDEQLVAAIADAQDIDYELELQQAKLMATQMEDNMLLYAANQEKQVKTAEPTPENKLAA